MAKQKILAVDDERHILELISYNLQGAGYQVETAETGEQALEMARDTAPDLILLDVMLPDIDGLQVCTRLKREPETASIPVIMLTARGDEIDKVLGLEMGADDYVVKPFDLAVLYSRILALLRRTKTVTDTKLFCDDLMLDKEKTAVYDGQKEIVVSQPEYRILLILMENKGKTITRNQLLEQVWDRSGNYVNDNTLTVTMKRLREKLNHPACLKTIRSFGYRMEDTQ